MMCVKWLSTGYTAPNYVCLCIAVHIYKMRNNEPLAMVGVNIGSFGGNIHISKYLP